MIQTREGSGIRLINFQGDAAEADFFHGRTFNYMTFVEQRHASDRSSGATTMFVSVGMMSNTWVLIIAGRQAKRPDIRYRSNV